MKNLIILLVFITISSMANAQCFIDFTNVGANLTEGTGTLEATANGSSTANEAVAVETLAANTDGYVQAEYFSASPSYGAFQVKGNSTSGTHIYGFTLFSGVVSTYISSGATSATSPNFSPSATLKIERIGSTITLYVNGTALTTVPNAYTGELSIEADLQNTGMKLLDTETNINCSTDTCIGDNLGDHTATQHLNMNNKQIQNVSHLRFRAGQGRGILFWNSWSYRIMMGNQAQYKYGPVQDYSIKTTMNNDPQGDRGWTWGVKGLTPVAAISMKGKMQLASDFTTLGQLLVGTDTKPTVLNSAGDEFGAFIEGGLLTEEVKVQAGPWPDYVFEEGYEMPTLEEVEAHIDANSCLPNTPSAAELEAQGGVDLGSMTVNQQEKIEELFLHMIELNKEIKAYETENQALESLIEDLAK